MNRLYASMPTAAEIRGRFTDPLDQGRSLPEELREQVQGLRQPPQLKVTRALPRDVVVLTSGTEIVSVVNIGEPEEKPPVSTVERLRRRLEER